MIITSESLCPDELSNEKIFIDRIIVYEVLSELELKIVLLWQLNFNRLSKVRSICLEELFQEIFFLEEHKQFNNLIQISSEVFFQSFVKKLGFRQKKISKVVKIAFYASSGSFSGKVFFPRKKIRYEDIFLIRAMIHILFWKFFGIFLKSATLCPDEFVEEKSVFFGAKIV